MLPLLWTSLTIQFVFYIFLFQKLENTCESIFPAEPYVKNCILLLCTLMENILVSIYSYTLCWELGPWEVVVYIKYQLL